MTPPAGRKLTPSQERPPVPVGPPLPRPDRIPADGAFAFSGAAALPFTLCRVEFARQPPF